MRPRSGGGQSRGCVANPRILDRRRRRIGLVVHGPGACRVQLPCGRGAGPRRRRHMRGSPARRRGRSEGGGWWCPRAWCCCCGPSRQWQRDGCSDHSYVVMCQQLSPTPQLPSPTYLTTSAMSPANFPTLVPPNLSTTHPPGRCFSSWCSAIRSDECLYPFVVVAIVSVFVAVFSLGPIPRASNCGVFVYVWI